MVKRRVWPCVAWVCVQAKATAISSNVLVKDASLTMARGGRITMSGIDMLKVEQRRTSAQTNADRQHDVVAGKQQIKVAVVGGGP